MSVISNLLGAIRSKRQAKFASVSEKYDSFIGQLAKGEQVNVDELADILDELDKSDADLEKDIANKQRRMAAAVELERLRKIAREIPTLEANMRQLDDELSAIIAAKKPAIAQAVERLAQAQLEVGRLGSIESELLEHGVPMHVAKRKEALHPKRKEFADKLREYESRVSTPQQHVRQLRNRIEVVDQRIARAKGGDVSDLKAERKSLLETLQQYQNQIDALNPVKAALDQERRTIEAEEQAIHKLLMQP